MTTFRNRTTNWRRITVSGGARERGYQHGEQLSKELAKLVQVFPKELKTNAHINLDDYINLSNSLARKQFDKCEEWREELEGMVEGAASRGVVVSVDFLFAWNMHHSISHKVYKNCHHHHHHNHTDHCSAFIATGDATKDGKIVMAHNTHTNFMLGQFFNIVQYVKPTRGHAFIMQTAPGSICSVVDWFLCESGIIGCETTIGYVNYLPKYGLPYFCRIRECMQYAKTLDDCVRIMREDNAGDYPCGWMFGDTNTNEIMLLEVAKTVAEPRRTKSGVFFGSNFAQDPFIRETQTTHGTSQPSPKLSVIARSNRLEWLLNKTYWGKLDAKSAKFVISDHYDVYAEKDQKGERTICKHVETEPAFKKRPANFPFGAIDGKVVTTNMAKKMTFWGIWGSSCGRGYRPTRTIKKRYPNVPNFKNSRWNII